MQFLLLVKNLNKYLREVKNMPVGPSHRRGGGGGGSSRSSSRSSHRSSSSRSYSSSSSYRSSRRYSSYDYYGGGASISIKISPRAWAIIGIIIGFLVAIICFCFGFLKIENNAPYRITMQKDAPQYQEIIERANRGDEGYYKIQISDIRLTGSSINGGNPAEYNLHSENGTPYNHSDNTYISAYTEVVKDGVNYYWLEISFWSEEVGERISCITYSYYPEAAVTSLSSLELAYTKVYDGDGSWDVINIGYNLKNNADYWYAGKQISTGSILIAVAIGLFALMVWCCMLVHKSSKKVKDAKLAENNFEGISRPTPNIESSKTFEDCRKFKVCLYCESHVDISLKKCPSCGASKFRMAKPWDCN